MNDGLGGELGAERDAGRLRVLLHGLDDFGHRPVDVEWEALERNRPGDVAQVVEHALDDDHLAIDRALEGLAVLDVLEHLQDQLAGVADVLDRMRQIVHQAGGDAPEHGLAFLFSHVFLQFDEPVGHRVERVAELADLVAAARSTRVRPCALPPAHEWLCVSAKMRVMNDLPQNQPSTTVPRSASAMAARS